MSDSELSELSELFELSERPVVGSRSMLLASLKPSESEMKSEIKIPEDDEVAAMPNEELSLLPLGESPRRARERLLILNLRAWAVLKRRNMLTSVRECVERVVVRGMVDGVQAGVRNIRAPTMITCKDRSLRHA